MRENFILNNLYNIYKYIVYFPLLGLSTAVFGSCAAVLAIVVSPKAGTIFGVIWARFNAYITPMFVKVYNKENRDPKQSYIAVANHQSQYDIFTIYGWFPGQFRWVMKQELRKVPFLGYSCYKIGHIFIDRKDRNSALEQINAAKERITDGTSILFFPEGKRSDYGELRDFKKGAFKFALDIGLPILPITIIGTRNILPNNSISLFPGKAKLVIGEPISIDGYDDENINELMDKTKAAIEKGFDV
jgi:1-acyl-sn-glycerol-3-phosphate acyltransferase